MLVRRGAGCPRRSGTRTEICARRSTPSSMRAIRPASTGSTPRSTRSVRRPPPDRSAQRPLQVCSGGRQAARPGPGHAGRGRRPPREASEVPGVSSTASPRALCEHGAVGTLSASAARTVAVPPRANLHPGLPAPRAGEGDVRGRDRPRRPHPGPRSRSAAQTSASMIRRAVWVRPGEASRSTVGGAPSPRVAPHDVELHPRTGSGACSSTVESPGDSCSVRRVRGPSGVRRATHQPPRGDTSASPLITGGGNQRSSAKASVSSIR